MDRNVPEAPAAAKVKTSLLSLPDEVLEHIVDLLAGEIIFLGAARCSRDGISNGDLLQLRLVNKRFARIVPSELYRAPNALRRNNGALSDSDLGFLLHPEVVQFAQTLSLAGTSNFYVNLLEARFCRLTTLRLAFCTSEIREAQKITSLGKLRQALQALPLHELRISIRNSGVLSRNALFHVALLGAGHTCLRKFCIYGPSDSRPILVQGRPTSDSSECTSSIESLAVSFCTTEQTQVIRNALGTLSRLQKLALTGGHDDDDNVTAARLAVLSSGAGHNILRVKLDSRIFGPSTWRALASLTQLESLKITTSQTFGGEHFPDLCFPKLACISTAKWYYSSIDIFLLKRMANRDQFPSVQKLELRWAARGMPSLFRHDASAIWEMVAAHNELLEARRDVKIAPQMFREKAMERLRQLEGSNGNGQVH